MNGRELIAWAARHDRRARAGWLRGAPFAALVGGVAIAAWVAWRASPNVAHDGWLGDPIAASHAWLGGAVVAFAIALMRVPFHVYWRPDASLLAQLPIDGGALFDAALWRASRAARTTTIAVLLGAAPLFAWSPMFAARHVALALALGLTAALLLPAVAAGAAAMVAAGTSDPSLRVVQGAITTTLALGGMGSLGGNRNSPPVIYLGLFPGLVSAVVLAGTIMLARWLTHGEDPLGWTVFAVTVVVAVLAAIAARASAPRYMAIVLRDVSALDRQRLAKLELHPPTLIERAIAARLGAGALVYRKDAQLMRRRYPMAFALGALAFLVLAIVGGVRPHDPTPWLLATIGGAAAYGVVLAGRLRRPPVELPRLAATLPIATGAAARAKLAWTIAWWGVFVVGPALFAALRQRDPAVGLVALAAGSLAVIAAGLRGEPLDPATGVRAN